LDEHKLDRVERWFARHGRPIVVVGRMMSVVRWLVGVPAGAARMPLQSYVPLTAIGCIGWNSLLMGAGLILGRNHDKVGHLAVVVSAALVVVVISAGIVLIRRHRPGGLTDIPE